VHAHCNGANRVWGLDRYLVEMVISGDGEALQALPDIGQGLARMITRSIHTGRSEILNRLQGEVSSEQVFQQVPVIGPELAERISH
jgi:hypothetical protein